MNRFTPLLCLLVLAGCRGDALLSKTEAPARRNTITPSFVIRANTFGPNGEIWMESGAKSLGGTRLVQLANGTVTWEDYSGPSALSTGGLGPFYDGGYVQIFAVQGGTETWLGNVTGDLSQEGHALTVPAGTTLKLKAFIYPHCTFSYFRTASGNIRTNPLVVSSGNVVANFHCDEDYGTPP